MAMDAKSELRYAFLSLFILLSSPIIFSIVSAADPPAQSVYELLPKYGLPSGLLPDCVKSYSLSEDGDFEVELQKPCYVQFDYLVYYEKKITGKLSVGSITKLKGIQVQRFLFWFDVGEIRVDLPPSDSIYFTVGIINKKLDVGQFKTVHSCRSNTLGSFEEFLRHVFEPPTSLDDIQMLLTE